MKEIKAALFDIDGTLLDTADYVLRAYEYTFNAHGLPQKSRDEIVLVMGVGVSLEECYRRLSVIEDISKLCETHNLFQSENIHLSLPFLNTQETLRRLKEAGVKVALVTARPKRTSIKTLETAGIIDYCDAVISGDDVERPKPHPDPLLKALKVLSVEPGEAVMIGDTEADILAGKNAAIRTIGVTYGFLGHRIAESEPDFIVDDIADVLPIILSGF